MTERGNDRKLVAIVMADVVGYSRLMGADESGTLATLRRHRRDFIDPTVAAHHGRVVNAPGDSLLLEFASAVGAVRCAIAIQQGMHARTSDVAPERRIAFRIGVNIGDIIFDRGEIFGDGVNVAARLEGLAEAGGICISRAAYEQIRAAIEIAFVDQGAHAVKNIARPIEVYALPAAVIAALPPMVLQAQGTSSRRRASMGWILAALGMLLLVSAIAGFFTVRPDPKPEAAPQDLNARLATLLPNMSDKARLKLMTNYRATANHRAFAMAPRSGRHWYSGDWASRAEAEEKTLERCQVAFGEACAVLAADDDIGTGPVLVRDMPKAHYAGSFDPYWIPGVRASVRRTANILGYAAASGPKAIAYNVRGLVDVVIGSSSQLAAETEALKACNAEPSRRDVDGPCLLYAVQNQVVLSERRTGPRSTP